MTQGTQLMVQVLRFTQGEKVNNGDKSYWVRFSGYVSMEKNIPEPGFEPATFLSKPSRLKRHPQSLANSLRSFNFELKKRETNICLFFHE